MIESYIRFVLVQENCGLSCARKKKVESFSGAHPSTIFFGEKCIVLKADHTASLIGFEITRLTVSRLSKTSFRVLPPHYAGEI